MDENKKTMMMTAAAVVLAVIAFFMAPSKITPDAFLDQGEPFFPDFSDPNAAAVLEVIGFDDASGRAQPFKVINNNGIWTIPSHHDYPADGQDRLAETAAGVIGIRKDDFRSDNVSEHEALGVIDPLDETAGLQGRGRRVTLKDSDGKTLADFIVGLEVPERQGLRFVRVPDQKRVYAARMNIDISTAFEDWIETDLLQATANEIAQIELNNYSINERRGSVERRDNLILNLTDGVWKAKGVGSGKKVDSTKIEEMLKTLEELTIVGVRPKPEGLSRNLREVSGATSVSQSDARSLRSKGFFFSRDGSLLSNEGEMKAFATGGTIYTLRFGEVVYGSGDAVSSGFAGETDTADGPAENRYLFITTDFNDALFPEPSKPGNLDFQGKADSLLTETDRSNLQKNDDHQKWEQDTANGRVKSDELNRRFADWYYVISAESFEKLHLTRGELIVSN